MRVVGERFVLADEEPRREGAGTPPISNPNLDYSTMTPPPSRMVIASLMSQM